MTLAGATAPHFLPACMRVSSSAPSLIAAPWGRDGAALSHPPFSRWPERCATCSCSAASTSAAAPAHAHAHTLTRYTLSESSVRWVAVGRPWLSDGPGVVRFSSRLILLGSPLPHNASLPHHAATALLLLGVACTSGGHGCARWAVYQVALLTELVLVVGHYPHPLLHDKPMLWELVIPRHVHRDLPPQERHRLRLRRARASLWAPHRFVHLGRPHEADQLAELISDGGPRGGHGSLRSQLWSLCKQVL